MLASFGAVVASSVTQKVTHYICTPAEVAAETAQVKEAKKKGIFILSEHFIERSCAEGKKADEAEFSLSDHINFEKVI